MSGIQLESERCGVVSVLSDVKRELESALGARGEGEKEGEGEGEREREGEGETVADVCRECVRELQRCREEAERARQTQTREKQDFDTQVRGSQPVYVHDSESVCV